MTLLISSKDSSVIPLGATLRRKRRAEANPRFVWSTLTFPALFQYVPDGQETGLEGSSQVNPLGHGKQEEDALELQVPSIIEIKTKM